MTQEEKVAYVFAQSIAAMAEIEGMKAENMQRQHRGESMAYTEDAFISVIDEYGIHSNAVIGLFRS